MANEPYRRMVCVCCFESLMLQKFDKRGKIYFACEMCHTHIFPRAGDISAIGYKMTALALERDAGRLQQLRSIHREYKMALADGKLAVPSQEPSLGSVPVLQPVSVPSEVSNASR